MQLAYMASHAQSELGFEPWVGDSQGSILLPTPVAPLTLDKNTNDIAACDIGVRTQSTLVLCGRRGSGLCGM